MNEATLRGFRILAGQAEPPPPPKPDAAPASPREGEIIGYTITAEELLAAARATKLRRISRSVQAAEANLAVAARAQTNAVREMAAACAWLGAPAEEARRAIDAFVRARRAVDEAINQLAAAGYELQAELKADEAEEEALQAERERMLSALGRDELS